MTILRNKNKFSFVFRTIKNIPLMVDFQILITKKFVNSPINRKLQKIESFNLRHWKAEIISNQKTALIFFYSYLVRPSGCATEK